MGGYPVEKLCLKEKNKRGRERPMKKVGKYFSGYYYESNKRYIVEPADVAVGHGSLG
jgi:hypothetical protein